MNLIVALAALALQASPELTPAQVERLERGEAVQVLQPVAGSPWPRSTVYHLIDATPVECAAVLSDYELQSSYIPRLRSSRVLKRSGADAEVEYVVSVPVYPDERSVSRQRVTLAANEYRVSWETVVDPSTRGSVTTGSATFRPTTNQRTGRAMTLMVHDQTVVPASVFARVGYVRNKAIETSREAAEAIRKQVEREKKSEPEKLLAQLRMLRQVVVRADSAR